MIAWKNVPLIPVTLLSLFVQWWHWRVSQPACQAAIRYDRWMQSRIPAEPKPNP